MVLGDIFSNKWPRGVRANGHLLLNSEKVIFSVLYSQMFRKNFLSSYLILGCIITRYSSNFFNDLTCI